jgi:8-oxo-dGTP diphosphatase
MEVQVFETKPQKFHAEAEVAGCYIEVEGRILLLQTGGDEVETGKWSIPGGKVEDGESAYLSAIRELYEETGIEVTKEQLRDLGCLYIRKPYFVFTFHLFQVSLLKRPEVKLSSEHTDFCWADRKDLERLPLMASAKEVLAFIQKRLLS